MMQLIGDDVIVMPEAARPCAFESIVESVFHFELDAFEHGIRCVLDRPCHSDSEFGFEQTTDIPGQIEVRTVFGCGCAERAVIPRRKDFGQPGGQEEVLRANRLSQHHIVIEVDVVLAEVGDVMESRDDRIAIERRQVVGSVVDIAVADHPKLWMIQIEP